MKIIKKIFCFIKSYFLQALLGLLAYESFERATRLGYKTASFNGKFDKYPLSTRRQTLEATDVAMSAGFDGGALAMGFICCTCLIMIVWLEISKLKKL